MYDVISVKLSSTNNVVFFDTNNLKLKKGDKVIIELEKIVDYGICVSNVHRDKKDNISFPLKKVLRITTKKDDSKIEELKQEAEKALRYAKQLSSTLKLDMNFVSSTYTFDKSQLYFVYTSDNRVDFRELAKKLAQKYKTRIELRQVGVRDKAKLIGGIGPCGLSLCCNTFLTDFTSVSINMAKNQFLALNPSKINGVCGRLLCCLNYEDDTYTDLKKKFPKIGNTVDTNSGKGKVISIDLFNQKYKVEITKNNYIDIDLENGSIK